MKKLLTTVLTAVTCALALLGAAGHGAVPSRSAAHTVASDTGWNAVARTSVGH
ncbi:hypothetical protein GCM10010260_43890 [Streptomyces filipinensis]|uniref:Uncharacterized protein n=1 Tax=Streptomyces filipinensis TaxID=66887 RepID=A0A918MCW8_9ACTN|nr:hypothetical protein [Streptomyces filipinensis]GGV02321.1 hypothetical protein GCM10010260_43890 [Streptomyces filipinensis]